MNLKKFVFIFSVFIFTGHASADQDITLVNHEYEGTKQWLPGTIFAYVGEKINITLINNVPSGIHGFTIPDFDQKAEVKKGEKKTLSFIATKAGIFPMKCQLHPAHVGGQLVILEKPASPKK